MTVSANPDKTNVSKIFSQKSLRYKMAAIVFCLTMIFAGQAVSAATFTVSNNNDDGAGSLRQAIRSANADATLDTIVFGSNVTTIMPLTPLPLITQPVIINGGLLNGQQGTAARVELSGATTADETGAATNDRYGLQLTATAAGSTIRGLIINRFGNAGIITAANNTLIVQNIIGTNLNNVTGIGNVNQGILIVGSTGNVIGGANAADRNVISGNQGSGITVARGGAAAIVNNYIGVGGNGTIDVGNSYDGILIADSSNSTIGGTDASLRNVISGNNGNGIYIARNTAAVQASGNVIRGNYIGVNALGAGADAALFNTSVGNDGSGVVIEAGGNIVGGGAAGAGNIISDNRTNGVSIGTNFGTNNDVAGNFVGVGVGSNGTMTPLRNRLNGIQITNLASRNRVGGADVSIGACDNSCNLIANNGEINSNSGRAGIYLDSSAGKGNAIRRNSIFSNSELGIDLAVPSASTDSGFVPGTGITANDPGDGDDGPNSLQNFPELTAADTNGAITGRLNSTPNTTFAVDFYRNDTGDSEAQIYIGSQIVRTDDGGTAVIGYATPARLTASQFVTSTATALSSSVGDTSEISASQAVAAATTQAGAGFEADVFNRKTGDTFLDTNDIAQVRSFVLRNETVDPATNEFQRADCFPFETRGDGFLDVNDIAQARSYALGFESRQSAGGPTQETRTTTMPSRTSSNSTDKMLRFGSERNAPAAPREVKVVSTSTSAGRQVTVPINVDAAGDESIYGFSVNYDTTKLTFVSVTSGTSGGTVDTNTMTPGSIGITVDFTSRPSRTIGAGNNQNLVNIAFTVAANAPTGTTPITFGDNPTRRSASNVGPPVTALPTTFTDGTVTINGATAATVSVGGRVTAGRRGIARARVSLTDERGATRVATTNALGYYRFADVEAGRTYTFNVQAKRYTFSAQVVNINEDAGGLNFTAAP